MRGKIGAVIVAGGVGRRMGGVRKQYLELAGEPVLLRALRPFLDHPRIGPVVVVLPSDDVEAPPGWLRDLPVTRVAGGVERADSVWNGLRALPAGTAAVLVHDGARPFVSPEVIDAVIERCADRGAVAAVRMTDTVKETDAGGAVVRTVDRSRLWRAQTPQGFPLAPLLEAYRQARERGEAPTDDAAVFERTGLPVEVVEDSPHNLKITTPADLRVAAALAHGLRAR